MIDQCKVVEADQVSLGWDVRGWDVRGWDARGWDVRGWMGRWRGSIDVGKGSSVILFRKRN